MAGNDWQRLAVFVAARMTDLGIDQADLGRLSSLSPPTISAIVDGTPRGAPRDKTLRRLERGLGWDVGSVVAVLAGGEPVVVGPAEGGQAPHGADTAAEISRLAARVDETQAILRAMMSAMLTDRQRAAIAQEVAEAQSQGRAPLREA